MAKQKNSGPVRYHNLAGFMRDLRKALDNGDTEGYELAELLIECDELIDSDGGGTPEEDDVSGASNGDTTDVESVDSARRVPAARPPQRPAEGSGPRSSAASCLDRALDYLAGEERSEAIAELDKLRMYSMGAPRVAGAKKRGA